MYFVYKYSCSYNEWILFNCAVSAIKALALMNEIRNTYRQKVKITRKII